MLPAEIAQAVKRIQFVTGRQVADVMAGAYLSVFKGRGMEFDEVRPYVPGDDIRLRASRSQAAFTPLPVLSLTPVCLPALSIVIRASDNQLICYTGQTG